VLCARVPQFMGVIATALGVQARVAGRSYQAVTAAYERPAHCQAAAACIEDCHCDGESDRCLSAAALLFCATLY